MRASRSVGWPNFVLSVLAWLRGEGGIVLALSVWLNSLLALPGDDSLTDRGPMRDVVRRAILGGVVRTVDVLSASAKTAFVSPSHRCPHVRTTAPYP